MSHYRRTGPQQNFDNYGVLLIGLTLLSGATTLLRERYFYQRDYGLDTLDEVEVLLSALNVASNVIGTSFVLAWSAGSLRPQMVRRLGIGGVALAALASPFDLSVGWSFVIFTGLAFYLLASQRAASMNRLWIALLAAVSAPIPTILVWHYFGLKSPATALAGYASGSVWQALGGAWAARGARVEPAATPGRLIWPVIYLGLIQLDALTDQALLLAFAPVGWAAAGAFSYNVFSAAVTSFLGPLSSRALARGPGHHARLRMMILGTAVFFLFVALLYPAVHVFLGGERVGGGAISRIEELSLCYGAAIPFSLYWQFSSRLRHLDTRRWFGMAGESVILLAIHSVVVVPLVVEGLWGWIPLATLAAFIGVTIESARRESRLAR